MASKQIGIRLNPDELVALRRVPGDNDSVRIKTLIRNQGIASGLATEISKTVVASLTAMLGETEVRLCTKIDDVHPAPVIRKLAEQLNPILSELLMNTRKIR